MKDENIIIDPGGTSVHRAGKNINKRETESTHETECETESIRGHKDTQFLSSRLWECNS